MSKLNVFTAQDMRSETVRQMMEIINSPYYPENDYEMNVLIEASSRVQRKNSLENPMSIERRKRLSAARVKHWKREYNEYEENKKWKQYKAYEQMTI